MDAMIEQFAAVILEDLAYMRDSNKITAEQHDRAAANFRRQFDSHPGFREQSELCQRWADQIRDFKQCMRTNG